MAARRYNFLSLSGENNILQTRQRLSKILFLTREDKSPIFKPTCNICSVYYIVQSTKIV
jgi:hypothetical protein